MGSERGTMPREQHLNDVLPNCRGGPTGTHSAAFSIHLQHSHKFQCGEMWNELWRGQWKWKNVMMVTTNPVCSTSLCHRLLGPRCSCS